MDNLAGLCNSLPNAARAYAQRRNDLGSGAAKAKKTRTGSAAGAERVRKVPPDSLLHTKGRPPRGD